MSISLYNTMSRKKEEFNPIKAGEVGLYTCGPTVYNYAHIGNFRAYIFEDLLRRTLQYHELQVTQVMNLTDVDDKTIRDSRAAALSLDEFTAKYKKSFFEDLETLRIESAEHYPAATDHIPEMITLIQTLLNKGYAYRADDGSIYYSIAKFPDYGKLAKIDMENQRSGSRVKNDEYAKDSVADFALWKAWDEADGDVRWDSPWGPGRPGWHIECSAMSMKYLGAHFDIHTGGIDNMFPHHEDEIAQSEAANDCKFVNYWLHNNYLIVNGEKMSKSLGNFFTLRDVLDKGYSGCEIRWVLLTTHYRKQLNFTWVACDQAKAGLKKFHDFFQRLKSIKNHTPCDMKSLKLCLSNARKAFADALGDDLNISEALAVAYNLEHEINRMLEADNINATEAELVLDQYRDFDLVLDALDVDQSEASAPDEILALAEERWQAKKQRDFAESDRLRDELKSKGWIIEDGPEGYRVKPV